MQLRDKFLALMALRGFVRDLSPEQAHLFHQIAARYQGDAEGFQLAVMTEFSQIGRTPAVPPSDLEIRSAASYALGRETIAVSEIVAKLAVAWPELHAQTRKQIRSDIETAIHYKMAGGAAEVSMWKSILKLDRNSAALRPELQNLRLQAARTAFDSYDFGDAVVEDHQAGWSFMPAGDQFFRDIYIQPETPGEPTRKGVFTVQFEPGTAVVRECQGTMDGNVLGPAPTTPSMR